MTPSATRLPAGLVTFGPQGRGGWKILGISAASEGSLFTARRGRAAPASAGISWLPTISLRRVLAANARPVADLPCPSPGRCLALPAGRAELWGAARIRSGARPRRYRHPLSGSFAMKAETQAGPTNGSHLRVPAVLGLAPPAPRAGTKQCRARRSHPLSGELTGGWGALPQIQPCFLPPPAPAHPHALAPVLPLRGHPDGPPARRDQPWPERAGDGQDTGTATRLGLQPCLSRCPPGGTRRSLGGAPGRKPPASHSPAAPVAPLCVPPGRKPVGPRLSQPH